MSDAELLRSRVVDDPTAVLARALDEQLTGHAHVESQDALLFGDDVAVRVVFDRGVPVRVAETTGDRDGAAAVEALVGPGPFAVEVYRRADGVDADAGRAGVPPDLPARRFGDDELATRTRAAAPGDAEADADPVSAFLDDAAAVEAIRDAAREEAVADAHEWGLSDHLTVAGGDRDADAGSEPASEPDAPSAAADRGPPGEQS
jgi:hypothetical protein